MTTAMSDLFISYSTDDRPFVKELVRVAGFRAQAVWVDYDNIPKGEKFWEEITLGIDEADAFVFIMSPDSVAKASQHGDYAFCRREIEYANKQGKRIIPVIYKYGFQLEADIFSAHKVLSERNWIKEHAAESDPVLSLVKCVEELLKAATEDLLYAKMHTRLLVNARDWDNNRREDALLRGELLVEAEEWLKLGTLKEKDQSQNKGLQHCDQVPTPLQQKFIKKSRLVEDTENERQRLLIEAKDDAEKQKKWANQAYESSQRRRRELEITNENSKRTIRKSRKILGAAILVSVSIIVATLWWREQAVKERKIALTETQMEREGNDALGQFKRNPLGNFLTVMRLSQEVQELIKKTGNREYLGTAPIYALQTMLGELQSQILLSHKAMVYSASYSPKGDRIVTASADKTARVWDVSGNLLAELTGHQASVTGASFNPQGNLIITQSSDKTARVWDVSGKLVAELTGHQDRISSASFNPQGNRIVTASDDKTARVWDVSGKLLAELKGHQGAIKSTKFSPDGNLILTASQDKTARLWDLSGKLLVELKGHQDRLLGASFSPKGDRILTISWDRTARLWDLSGNLIAELKGHQDGILSAAFNPQGDRIATASFDGKALVWDLSGRQIFELKGHRGKILDISFSPKGDRILTASFDGTARVWDLEGKQIAELTGHGGSVGITATLDSQGNPDFIIGSTGAVETAAFNPEGDRVLTASSDNTARIWDFMRPSAVVELKGNRGDTYSASFNAPGDHVVTASYLATAQIWDLSGKLITELKGQDLNVQNASFNPQSDRILTAPFLGSSAYIWDLSGKQIAKLSGSSGNHGVNDGTARVWDFSGIQLPKTEKEFSGSIFTSASFSPKGDRIATTFFNGNTALVWDLSGNLITEFKAPKNRLLSANFNQQGNLIVSRVSSKDEYHSRPHSHNGQPGADIIRSESVGPVLIWDLTGKVITTIEGHPASVNSANFNFQGDRIITASNDETSKIWDLSGKQVLELRGHQDRVTSASFNFQGDRIVTASDDKTIRVWDSSGKLLTVLRGHQRAVNMVSFNPKGDLILSASSDGTARLWKYETLEETLTHGCNWLAPYLETHPEALKKLPTCQSVRGVSTVK